MAKKGKSRKAPTAAQLANQDRFRRMVANTRGAVGFARGAVQKSSTVHSLKDAFHRISWGVAGLSALAAYYLPSTASSLGLGRMIYDRVPGYARLVDSAWQGSHDVGIPDDINPWNDGGLVGVGKTVGLGLGGKIIYDFEQHGRISRGKLNVGLPAALGLILDGPELHPMAPGGPSSSTGMGSMVSQGGVSW